MMTSSKLCRAQSLQVQLLNRSRYLKFVNEFIKQIFHERASANFDAEAISGGDLFSEEPNIHRNCVPSQSPVSMESLQDEEASVSVDGHPVSFVLHDADSRERIHSDCPTKKITTQTFKRTPVSEAGVDAVLRVPYILDSQIHGFSSCAAMFSSVSQVIF